MNGLRLMTLFPAGVVRDQVLERLRRLEGMPVGARLDVTDLNLQALDGRPLAVQATAVRVDTASGVANLSIFFDITARKAVEGALRRSEAMLSHLFATSPDTITLTEISTGRYAMVNEAFTRLTGYRADEVIGRTAIEMGLWSDLETRRALLERLERDGKVVDMPAVFVGKSGQRISTLMSAGRFAMAPRDYLVLSIRDVTAGERTRLQHAAILERASIGIAFTRDQKFVEANPFFERMFGWDAGRVGRASPAWWSGRMPSDHRRGRSNSCRPAALGRPAVRVAERRMRRKDGSSILVHV